MKFSIKFKSLLAALLMCAGFSKAQNIVFSGCNGSGSMLETAAPNNYTFVNVGTDATGRNIFQTNPFDGAQSCSLGVCELQISWNAANSRWEMVADDLVDAVAYNGTNLLLFNTSASTPNPPDASLGAWIDANAGNPSGDCDGTPVSSLTGDVQSTVTAAAGLQIATADTMYSIDFDNTLAGINNGSYAGTGLALAPAAGLLDSNGIVVTGFSDGDSTLGGTSTTGDFARGTGSGNVITGGLYAFDVSNGGTVDRALGVKPAENDFTSGSIAIRFENRTGAAITDLAVSYEIHTFDNTTRTNSFDLAHGTDISTATAVTDLGFNASGDNTAIAGTSWKANYLQTDLAGLTIANGDSYYLVWNSNDEGGSGSRPQIALDDVSIIANPSTLSSTMSGTYDNAIIDGSTAITLASNLIRSLELTGGDLTTNANLTFSSSATRSAILKEVGSGTIIGHVTVEQYYPANRAFRFVSFPVDLSGTIYDSWQESGGIISGLGTHITGGTADADFDQSGSNDPSFFLYDSAGLTGSVGWRDLASFGFGPSDPLTFTSGFPVRVMIRGDRTISLTTNAAPTVTRLRTIGMLKTGDIDYVGDDRSPWSPGVDGTFYFVGNPYQAQVDLSQSLNTSNSEDFITTRYYAWQPVTENYVTYDFASGGLQNGVTNFIQPGQSFFVQTDEASGTDAGYDPEITFRENQKSNATFTTATYSQPEASYEIKMFDQTLLGGSIANDLVRGFINTGSNNAYDNQDALKVRGLREQLFIMSNARELSVERRNHFLDQEIIDLNITNMKTGAYTFELKFNGLNNTTVHLVDQHLRTSTIVNQGTIETYTFDIDLNVTASFAQDRFYVSFTTSTLSVGNVAFAKAVQWYPNPVASDILNVSGLQSGEVTVTVTNLLGQQMNSRNMEVSGNSVQINGFDNLNSGIYLVTLLQEGQSVTKRVVVE